MAHRRLREKRQGKRDEAEAPRHFRYFFQQFDTVHYFEILFV